MKNPSKMPLEILDQGIEYEGLDKGKEAMVDVFKCEIEIIKAENSKEAKAKQAIPSKPAILVS